MALIGAVLLLVSVAPAANKPNIIVILADDLGYHDLGILGATDLKTPHLDSLATNGIRFTSGYVSAPICSPSRAGLMTGRCQQRFGHETNPGLTLEKATEFGLPVTESTIANRLKPLNYATGWIGKSHLGAVPKYHPLQRGFDEFFGFLEGHHSYTNTCDLGNDPDPIRRDYTPVCETNYLTYAFAREITNFIAHHAAEPFFIYAPFNATHVPFSATPELYARFNPADFSDPNRYEMAAVLAGLDDAVGVILSQLRALNLETNTLIVFTSDNGAPTPSNGSLNTPLKGYKTTLWEGGIRVPFLMQWTGTFPSNTIVHAPITTLDILPTAVAAAGGDIPASWQLDGVNLLPFLTGQTAAWPHTNLFWRIETDGLGEPGESQDGIRAVRSGDWKLVKPGLEATWELYDLATDIGEANNLANSRPDKVAELLALYEGWAAQLAEPRWAYNSLYYERLDFIPEDIRIGVTNVSYLAPEFLPGGAQVAFLDATGQLWRGDLDFASGRFASGHGNDVLVDSGVSLPAGAVTRPQWGLSTNGPALFYTRTGSFNHLQVWRARFTGNTPIVSQLTAAQSSDRFSPRASQQPVTDSVKLVFNAGTIANPAAIWANENSPASVQPLLQPVGASAAANWLPDAADFAYNRLPPFSNYSQVARFHTASNAVQTLTDEHTQKSDVYGFLAPEFNHELCYAAVVDHEAIAIYRDLHDNTNGFFTRVATLTLPTNTPLRYLYSMQPLAGQRGFNGTSWFTAAAYEDNDPENPGDSGIWLFGLGPSTNNLIVRRLDEGAFSTNRFAGRREPRTVIGEREVFCYYTSDDGTNAAQLRLARTGLSRPDYAGPASGFTNLRFTQRQNAGTNDLNNRLVSATETLHLVAHQGQLFAGTGNRHNDPYPSDTNNLPANWTGAQILVKDSPTTPWRVDEWTPPIFRAHLRVEALESFTFTTKADGSALNPPANLLLAGLSDITTNGADVASVRTRMPGTADGWVHSTVATSTIPANVISFGSHVDAGSGVHVIFAGLQNGDIYRGVLNSNAPGLISWFSGDRELAGGGPVTAFAECGAYLYAVSALRHTNTSAAVVGGLFVRNDASNRWVRVYKWNAPADVAAAPEDQRLALGLTAVRDPQGTSNQVLLLARAWPGVIERVDPADSFHVTTELDVRDFVARQWNDDRVRSNAVTIAYTGFTAARDPVTGETVHLVGVWLDFPDTNSPAFAGSHFLIRHLDGTYEAADIPNDQPGNQLRATRCIAVSPFVTDGGSAFYFGGYDTAENESHHTAWILRGAWSAWPALTISRPDAGEVLLTWPPTDTAWLLEASPFLGDGADWQPVTSLPTRSIFGSLQSVATQSGNEFFRLRRP